MTPLLHASLSTLCDDDKLLAIEAGIHLAITVIQGRTLTLPESRSMVDDAAFTQAMRLLARYGDLDALPIPRVYRDTILTLRAALEKPLRPA